MHSGYVEDVGLPSPLLAEVQFVDCVINARFSLGRKTAAVAEVNCSCTNHPYLPTCKAKANELGKRLRNQASLHVLYAS